MSIVFSRMMAVAFLAVYGTTLATAETLRHPLPLEEQLKAVAPAELAVAARRRGDPVRGALVFFKSAAACVNCHGVGDDATPLGPDLAKLGEVTDVHVIESLLRPSLAIRKGYETYTVLTVDGAVHSGLKVDEDSQKVVLRLASDLSREVAIDRDEIEAIKANDKSLMPEGIVASLPDQRDFFDLARYVMEVAAGGPSRAKELRPSEELLAVRDDSVDLNHAGIIKKLRSRDFETGKGIYHGYCFNCHGNDGNTPSLPTARAFGTQKLKFGSDPYRMFMTLTRGNGLMAPMSHLTPKERYQVVHYIREAFMKDANPDYFRVDDDYLTGLPKGTKDGTEVPDVQRDFGPALASQLRRDFPSVLTVKLGNTTVSYDLHTMNQAAIWRDGFLDLSNTQHVRDRGEGTADPQGTPLPGLQGWQWAHGNTFDYSRDGLLPRGPLPTHWMHYRGHALSGDQVVLRYTIDGREIDELPAELTRDRDDPSGLSLPQDVVRHVLRIGPGKRLLLAAAAVGDAAKAELRGVDGGIKKGPARQGLFVPFLLKGDTGSTGPAGDGIALSAFENKALNGKGSGVGHFTAAGVTGDVEGLTWRVDDSDRLCLEIPASETSRQIEVVCATGEGSGPMLAFKEMVKANQSAAPSVDFDQLLAGGPARWAQTLKTIGYPGLEQGGYALDTLTLPDATPWNTWFRTSALDFFPDGRMALATHGGDIWIVSGIDDSLMNLTWKRFAGGLYEPFGVKVVDGQIYVTCKDRLTRLHDHNGDGEADFYESFSADEDVSVNFHAFNFDLQTDNEGNFYYAKSGHGADTDLPGAVIKVSADGKYREIYCTGFRTPNGMGSLPDGRLTVSDNQGQWTPASQVNLVRRGGYYGWVGNYSIPGMWEPGGGTIDIDKVVAPETFDPPLVWMPQEFDNSSGGQVWVGDDRWGPLSGRLLHTSFGKGWMYYLMMQEFDDSAQAAIVKLPFDFRTGIMRGRVNPADGQVYAVGLQGWNGGGRPGLKDKGVQRLRFTGRHYPMLADCQVVPDGLRLRFNFPLDPKSAAAPSSYQLRQWNYRRRKEYGSDMYSPTTGKPGIDDVDIESVTLSDDGRGVTLNIPGLRPVQQIHLLLNVQSRSGAPFAEEVYWTLNRVPSPEATRDR